MTDRQMSRRRFLAASGALAAALSRTSRGEEPRRKARLAVTLDLEMSREYPRRGMTEWDYEKGNLDEPTKQYAVEAARLVKQAGGRMHFFCVGRVLEQPDVDWLKQIAAGHAVGNHTYDHVYVLATRPEETQFRFRRAPWLIRGKSAVEVIEENIRLTTIALKERAGIAESGFRTPGGFADGLAGRDDVQQMLRRLGYTWVSSKYPRHEAGREGASPPAAVFDSIVAAQRESQPFVYPSGLVEVPMSPISDVNAFRSNRWKLADFLKAIRLAVEWTIENRAVFDFLAHPSCLVVEDPEFESIRLICELVRSAADRAELSDLATIAAAVEPA
ncbi:MAG TPA: polysaccharide deacetylase family protein [Pirellulales bacterium]|jgi:peptidoglycan/xylan/chitin deacetylase (PgdA/CDA1 family)|nr:polysaccharide deacetylase family protein [Pirellulales bacterium]